MIDRNEECRTVGAEESPNAEAHLTTSGEVNCPNLETTAVVVTNSFAVEKILQN